MNTIPVTLVFADGVARRIHAQPGQNLLEAAAEAGLPLLSDCSNGMCGTCTCTLASGQVELGDYDPSVLPDDEREDGSILACVSRVQEACVVEIPYDSDEVGAQEEAISGTVISVEQVAQEVMRLEVQAQQALEFHPGQYVRLRPEGQDEWRSYSMANESGATRLVFYVRLVEGGLFSSWLAKDAKPGAQLELSPPRGTFFLRSEKKPRLFVAGGTGLAPFLSMLEQIAAGENEGGGATTLLVGARTANHLFAREQLQQLGQRIPGLQIHYAAEAGAADDCASGYATDLIKQLELHPDTRVYLCGPPPMVEAGRNALAARGLNPREALCERFA